MNRKFSRPQTLRRGGMMVVVIVCLVVSMGIAAESIRSAILVARQSQIAQERLQLEVLVDDAMAHGLAERASNPEYEGELWTIDATQWAEDVDARVTSEFTNQNAATQLVVVGELLRDGQIVHTLTESFEIESEQTITPSNQEKQE